MMKIHLKALVGAALAAALFFAGLQPASAGTIIKLSLGDDAGADVEYSGGVVGVLSTLDDGVGGTTGEQNTSVEFLGELSSMTDIVASASYTLNGVTSVGPAMAFGTTVFQNMTGGTFQLYDASNTLLLDVILGDSMLFGQLGNPQGATISTTFGSTTGFGSLDSLIIPGTVGMSISMASINGNAGLSAVALGPGFVRLNAFQADASKIITANVVPEPTAAALWLLSGIATIGLLRRRGR